MRFKRYGAAFLAAALAAAPMAVYSYAEEDAAMKKELTIVKQRFDIPEDYTEFSYRTNIENKSTRYTFTWSKEKTSDSISVSITGNVIKRVSINRDYSDEDTEYLWGTSFAKMSDKKLKSAAKKYMQQINPTIADRVAADEDISVSLWGNAATLSFHRTANGVPVTNQTGTIIVDKNTGELLSYNFNWINGASFSDTKGAITVEAAQKAYKGLFPTELVYTLEYDWENDKYKPHLVYRQTSSGQINAFTGELSTFEDYRSYNIDDDDACEEDCDDDIEMATADVNPGAGANSKAVSFSDAELEKLEQESKLIKADAAIKLLQDMNIFYIPSASEVQGSSCYYDAQRGSYIRNVSFSGSIGKYIDLNGDGVVVPVKEVISGSDEYQVWGYFSIDAESGELLNFYAYAPDNGTGMDEKKTLERAETVMKKLLGEKWTSDFGKLTNTSSSKSYKEYDSNTGKPKGEPRITSMTFMANREAYGIVCTNENASLSIANNGFVTSYDVNYHSDITYPKPDNIISESKAYKNFFKERGLKLFYRCAYRTDTKKVVTALVYDTDGRLYVDAFSGKLTDSVGRPMDEQKEIGEYTDISNSKYKKYAEKLRKYGITLMDEKGRLNENEAVTYIDFRNLLSNAGTGIVNDETIKDDDKLDRKTIAKLLVMSAYGKDVAELTSIFKAKFSDVPADSKYLGYIAIADATGMIEGIGDKFAPDAAFTRGEAIKYLYDRLSK